MTFIPFKSDNNRLYLDLETCKSNLQLRDYINEICCRMPGTFVWDYTSRKVWFYPPENYVMPPCK